MIHTFTLNGLHLRTGDIICTTDGDNSDIGGQFWRLVGKLVPGDVDHIVIYVGPGGWCVEAAAKAKVVAFEIPDNTWNAQSMVRQRGPIIDTLYGAAYPLKGKGLSATEENKIREKVARYCRKQAENGIPYNINFLNSSTERAFYCSQLAYKAYLHAGIDLNTGAGIPNIPLTENIIFPQEIWSGCPHARPKK